MTAVPYTAPAKLIRQAAKKLNIFVTLCIYKELHPETAMSLNMLTHCPDHNVVVKYKNGDALIDRSRSIVATRFLESQEPYDILFFIDGDIVFNPKDVIKICKTMDENDLDICGGAYVKKIPVGTHPNVKLLEQKAAWTFGDKGGVFEVRCVSTGFMGIRKRVFEKMVEEARHYPKYHPLNINLCHPNDLRFYPFFEPYQDKIDGQMVYLSEDWAFCERARNLGFKVWCDGTTSLKHMGEYPYEFSDGFRPGKPAVKNFQYWEEGFKPKMEIID